MSILKPTRAIQLNKSHPLSRGIVGCWLMNEGGGGKIFDLSGNGNNGILYGNTHFVPGKFGNCLSFDGSGDYVSISENTAFNFTTQGFSISIWVRGRTDGVAGVISRRQTEHVGNIGYAINVAGGVYRLYIDGDNYQQVGNTNDNNWYHIVLTSDGTTKRIYCNSIIAGSITAVISSSSYSLVLGRFSNDLNDYYFNGEIDDVMIFNRALSATEVAQLYREPFCMFERVITPAVFSVPFINLAGSSPAQSSTSTTAKLTKRISGALAATTNVTAILKIIGEVLIAGSIDTSAVPSGKLMLNYRGPWLRSPLRIERQWLTDALFNGMTDSALKLGTILSSGWFWMRPSGCSVLYRGTSMEQIDFANILAVVEQDTGSMSPPSFVRHNSDSTYFYVLRRFNNCGYQERTLQASVKMTFDADGNLARSQPNNIFAARADQVDGDKVQLVWFYCPLEQSSQPALFKIYCDGGTGQIDFENPIAEIRYHGIKYYGYITDTLSAVRYLFAIRVEDVSGMQNNSSAQIIIQISTESPDTPEILSVEAI